MLYLIFGVVLGIILMKVYLFFKGENEISSVKPNDVVVTKDNRVAIFLNYHRNFDYLNIKDEIIYTVKDIHTNIVHVIGKSTVKGVIKQSI